MLISICVPTYNRPESLTNLLNSLVLQTKKNFEVCISDNCSKKNIYNLVSPYKKKLNIKINKNKKNLGFALNLLKVSSMAKGEFIWFVGDDDLLIKNATERLQGLILKNKECDFFWINSFNLNSEYLKKFPFPFTTNNLPKNMKMVSLVKEDIKLNFFDLIDYRLSSDFLFGMFLSVFRRKKWDQNLHVIDKKLIKDPNPWSNFENTCFFLKVYCEAFKKSKAYFCSEPLSVNLFGIREWGNLYPLIEIVRMPEALDYYRSKGLNFFRYVICKNYALRNFFNYFFKIFINGNKMGLKYVNLKKHFFMNLIYPNAWLSILYFFFRKIYKNKKFIN